MNLRNALRLAWIFSLSASRAKRAKGGSPEGLARKPVTNLIASPVTFALTAAFAFLFVVSGTLLWLGERDTRFRLDGTIVLHDVLTYASVALVAGHLYLAVIHPTTRHALRGITLGSVREDWAREHHSKWPTDAQ